MNYTKQVKDVALHHHHQYDELFHSSTGITTRIFALLIKPCFSNTWAEVSKAGWRVYKQLLLDIKELGEQGCYQQAGMWLKIAV